MIHKRDGHQPGHLDLLTTCENLQNDQREGKLGKGGAHVGSFKSPALSLVRQLVAMKLASCHGHHDQ